MQVRIELKLIKTSASKNINLISIKYQQNAGANRNQTNKN